MNVKPTPVRAARREARGRRRRHAPFAAALLALAAALSVPAAAQQARISQGALLVATDEIGDPSWSRTVVLILHHDSNGTLGVAVNRPTSVQPEEILPELGDVPGLESSVFRGGPVRPTQMVFLIRDPTPGMLRNAPLIVDGIYASGDLSALAAIAETDGSDRMLRLYAGHAEWGPGQLDAEIAGGRWAVTNGSAERVFAPNPEMLWQRLSSSGDELLVGGPR